ncbi:hypothetical protein [Ruminococcus albus]|uniref:hypothetical protein n=1 Tax=Ruminococcus albus TaxID=1264 RepID=UPI000313F4F4|nr:hypothetical protein [Ruminococcus albus]MCC3349380.1 hypothetical protein [Ruminococcus albus 8]
MLVLFTKKLCDRFGHTAFSYVVIPLTHHKNGGLTELKVVGVWALNYPFVYSIFSWCAKGIVII